MDNKYRFKDYLNMYRAELGVIAREFEDLNNYCKYGYKEKEAIIVLDNILKWNFDSITCKQMRMIEKLSKQLYEEMGGKYSPVYPIKEFAIGEYVSRYNKDPDNFITGLNTLFYLSMLRPLINKRIQIDADDNKLILNIMNIIENMNYKFKDNLFSFINCIKSKIDDDSTIVNRLINLINDMDIHRFTEPDISMVEMALSTYIDIVKKHDRNNIVDIIEEINNGDVSELVLKYNTELSIYPQHMKIYRLLLILLAYYEERAKKYE